MNVKMRWVDNVRVLELAGSIDWSNEYSVRQAIVKVTEGYPAQVVVNMQGVNKLDSCGLSALIVGLKRARENGGDLRLCYLQSPVRMILELTRFDRLFEIFNSEEDAVLAAAKQH
jgi:anti-anti-sigma factor